MPNSANQWSIVRIGKLKPERWQRALSSLQPTRVPQDSKLINPSIFFYFSTGEGERYRVIRYKLYSFEDVLVRFSSSTQGQEDSASTFMQLNVFMQEYWLLLETSSVVFGNLEWVTQVISNHCVRQLDRMQEYQIYIFFQNPIGRWRNFLCSVIIVLWHIFKS